MKYAVDCEVIDKSPRIGMFKCERPEIVAWDFEQYARLLASAKVEGEEWYAAICLAGEAGLRVGEVKALRWREDVDMIARTITVNFQTRNKQTTTPKGRTRRSSAKAWSCGTSTARQRPTIRRTRPSSGSADVPGYRLGCSTR